MDLAKRKEELVAELEKANLAIEQSSTTAFRIQGAIAICDELIAEEQAVKEVKDKEEP